MAYKKKTYVLRNAIEVEEYHTSTCRAPGMKRLKKKKPTPEQVERINQRNKEKLCRRKLREHFDVNDYFVTMTYERSLRPEDMETAKEHFKEFLRIVRREYKKRKSELKWIRNIEVGSRGAWHVHLVVNRIDDTDIILRKAWKYGKVITQLMYEKGEFSSLAAYITKTEKTDKRLKETNYSTSRNLPIPEPNERTYRRWRTWKDNVKVPEGYYIEPDSLHEGINPVTGYPYRTYTLLRLRAEHRTATMQKTKGSIMLQLKEVKNTELLV